MSEQEILKAKEELNDLFTSHMWMLIDKEKQLDCIIDVFNKANKQN